MFVGTLQAAILEAVKSLRKDMVAMEGRVVSRLRSLESKVNVLQLHCLSKKNENGAPERDHCTSQKNENCDLEEDNCVSEKNENCAREEDHCLSQKKSTDVCEESNDSSATESDDAKCMDSDLQADCKGASSNDNILIMKDVRPATSDPLLCPKSPEGNTNPLGWVVQLASEGVPGYVEDPPILIFEEGFAEHDVNENKWNEKKLQPFNAWKKLAKMNK